MEDAGSEQQQQQQQQQEQLPTASEQASITLFFAAAPPERLGRGGTAAPIGPDTDFTRVLTELPSKQVYLQLSRRYFDQNAGALSQSQREACWEELWRST